MPSDHRSSAQLTDTKGTLTEDEASFNTLTGTAMTREHAPHIEPSKHSTKEVDEFLRQVEANVDVSPGPGSPAIIKPNKDLGEDGKPDNETPKNPRT